MRNRLRELRLEREWTQKRLAAELGVSRQTVIAIEKGKYAPSLPLAFKISRVLSHRLEDIFFDEDP